MPKSIPWSRQQLLAVFRLYCRTPFGKLHQKNPDIIALAGMIGRTPSAVGMKACNFASLDPSQQARRIAALANTSNADRQLWGQFQANPESVAAEAEAAYALLPLPAGVRATPPELAETDPDHRDVEDFELPTGPTESLVTIRARRVQSFFRAAVLASYGYHCALSDIAVPGLLNASHIIPWNQNVERRANPRNGIALNALYDRAFDRGLITFDEDLRLVVSRQLKDGEVPDLQRRAFFEMEGRQLRRAERFAVDAGAMGHHRENIFSVE